MAGKFGTRAVRYDIDLINAAQTTVTPFSGDLGRLVGITSSSGIKVAAEVDGDTDAVDAPFRTEVPTGVRMMEDITLTGTARRQSDGTIDPNSAYARLGDGSFVADYPKRTYRETYRDGVSTSVEVWVKSRNIMAEKGRVVHWTAVLSNAMDDAADYVKVGH